MRARQRSRNHQPEREEAVRLFHRYTGRISCPGQQLVMAQRARQQYQPASAKLTPNRLQQRDGLLARHVDVDQYQIEAALVQRGGGLSLGLYAARYVSCPLQPRTDHLAEETIVLYHKNRASAMVLVCSHCRLPLK